ncbi:GntR family transcriptional regulator YhfZ [Desnuesiella massiliensis]|uniref:GntR family transcriptional regulator YhfZ n=1 Tax=Desnuesiella massiliensis TaxID=1650662 RepID=UPI0006E3AC4B|nr:GntR family transcriptional regulator YhfZ [Desnuesiella massiliensis]
MDIKMQLMQKNGLVAIKLARELMTMSEGDRIPTVAAYAEKYGTARGTVQSALKLLEEHRAISLEPRGHLGTFISFMDYKVLWQFTDLGTIMGVMPLPYSKLYEGLATGLYKTMHKKEIPFSLAYMRGAVTRLKALEDARYDFAIVSKLAAKHSMEKGANLDIAVEFGEYSYVNEHALLFADPTKNKIEDGMKIGIDSTSIDHYLLTISQCKEKKVQFIDIPYNQVIMKLENGNIDAAIWNIDEIIERKLEINYQYLDEKIFKREDTEAVIVINKNNYGVRNLLAQFISGQEVIKYQLEVVAGELIPNY